MKTIRLIVLCAAVLIAAGGFAQTTEGKDFWVTFMQTDQGDNDMDLELAISSRYDCSATISNPFTGYSEQVNITANETQVVTLYSGSPYTSVARPAQTTSKKVCYAFNSEQVDTCALHVVADQPISLFASNYKYATFDATNVLPTPSLQNDYIIQTYSPSDHAGDAASQGSHFAIIATEDNTVVDYYPTVMTKRFADVQARKDGGYLLTAEDSLYLSFVPGTKYTVTLNAGEVYYVWTGKAYKEPGDLSGTRVTARGGKKIAVFQGCPHTNIPYAVKQRDHIYSQAMPVNTWGNTFVLTASNGRKRDIYRVMALNDGTEVYVGDSLVHTFNFATETKHYWEFEMGSAYGDLAAPLVSGTSCYLHTSCPCAVHQFMVSQQYDGDKNNDGDPAMLWINPIEQQIDQITFTTYYSKNAEKKGTTSKHNVNIVTAYPQGITLDGVSIASEFQRVNGDTVYWYARHALDTLTKSYTLKATEGGFIAHVYGFTRNESYAYSAGGYAKTLEQYILINGERFSASTQNTLCGKDTIHFKCDANYDLVSVKWIFGDGQTGTGESVDHYYANTAVYQAYCIIERESSNLCAGQMAIDTIPITVNIGKLELAITDTIDDICATRQLTLEYRNTGTALTKSNCTYTFNDKAKKNGFTEGNLYFGPNSFILTVPEGAEEGDDYSFTIDIQTGCGDTTMVIGYSVPFDPNKLLARRWDDVLAVYNSEKTGYNFVSYQWYKNGEPIEGETGPTLSLDATDLVSEYYVCMKTDINTQVCTCPTKFVHSAGADSLEWKNNITVSALSVMKDGWIYVNADEEGTAKVYDVRGNKIQEMPIQKGGAQIFFHEQGLYIVDVRAGKMKQYFKIYVY